MKNAAKLSFWGACALLGAALLVTGCKSAPELTQANAQALIQAKYDQMPAVGTDITVDDLGMRQGVTAKYWTGGKIYPNKFWADFTLTPEGKKALTLASGSDVIEWRPESPTDPKCSILVTTVAANHLKARDVKDPQDDVGGTKTAMFTEAVDLDGVPQPLQEIAHNPGNKLSSARTATFMVDGGAWKLQSIN
jgi:hypothetical protein